MPPNARRSQPGLIRIAGAGPAGLACAIELASRGIACEVHERHRVVGGRFDGDHQILPAFGDAPWGDAILVELGISESALEFVPLHSARFFDGTRRSAVGHSERPFAWLVRRGPQSGTLDHAMAARARELGVKIHTGHPLRPDHANVVATGLRRVDGLAIEEMFQTEAEDRVDVLLDESLAPGGYAYLFVRGGEATLGIAALGSFKDLGDRLAVARERFRKHGEFAMRNARSAAHGMNFGLPGSAVEEGRPCVGEAAGFQDFLFGLGLRMAIVSGKLSASAIAEDLDYDRLWKEALCARMQTSLVDRWLYERGAVRRWLMRRLGSHDLQVLLNDLQQHHWSKQILLPWVKRFRVSGQDKAETKRDMEARG